MHCKNVDVRSVDPPERLSKKHERRYGRPLTRYHVLNIEPMRRVLTSEGEAQTKGLRHAMHICRGHFKTYTEEAPLFGRHTGTYWWESEARGKPEHGVVEKDTTESAWTGREDPCGSRARRAPASPPCPTKTPEQEARDLSHCAPRHPPVTWLRFPT
jgi:hypothetical protein